MLACINQLEKVDNVDKTDLQVWQVSTQKSGGGKGFVSRHITAGCHDKVRLFTLVIRSPLPDPYTLRAVCNGLVHGKELEVLLLVCNNDVDVILTAQAVIHGG